jgi:hypothetical protein
MCQTKRLLPTGGEPKGQDPPYILKGQIVVYNVYAMHRDSGLWVPMRTSFVLRGGRILSLVGNMYRSAEGQEFVWDVSAVVVIDSGIDADCLSEQLALTEAGYTMVRLLQTFERMERRGDEHFREMVGVTLAVAGGVLAALMEN